jgi:integrase
MELLAEHLAKNVADNGGALVFAGEKGGRLHRGNFNKRVRWVENVAAIGAPRLHFHDLRHTGTRSQPCRGLRDLMTRMGQDSMRAALI